MTQSARVARRVGSFSNWLMARLFQCFFPVMGLRYLRERSWEFFVVYITAFVATTAAFLSLAYGKATDQGIAFRRYLKLHRRAWDQVQTAEWGGISGLSYMTLALQDTGGVPKSAQFAVITDIRQLSKSYSRGEPPEVVSWVMRQMSIPCGT